jgi:SAM-dependent methyltransferase
VPDERQGAELSVLIIVASSLVRRPAESVRSSLSAFFSSQSPQGLRETTVLLPAGTPIDASQFGSIVAFPDTIGLERNREIWWPLRLSEFRQIVVLGTAHAADFEEIVLACFLRGASKLYLNLKGDVRSMGQWEAQMRPEYGMPAAVRIELLGDEYQRNYLRFMHRRLASDLINHDFLYPTPISRSPERSIYTELRLAVDLAQLTPDLHVEDYGASFSILQGPDGAITYSPDFYRSISNYVTAIDGIETVLDMGCGSGFLACYLAASGKYRNVLGVDSSPQRIDGARLHAELIGSRARFEVMSMSKLDLPDRSVDLVVTSFALEQSGPHLGDALQELRRVAKKLLVLFEPTTQFFPTLMSMWHTRNRGWASDYNNALLQIAGPYAARPNLLSHYFNGGTVFVVDLETQTHPALRFPHLFRPGAEGWPGGIEYIKG